jgi:hypothetical protein
VALRLDTGKIDWNEVGELMRGSYILLVAPNGWPLRSGANLKYPDEHRAPIASAG